jgi:hypothetical protein
LGVGATNPAAAVRGPKHVVKTSRPAKKPVLDGAEWRKLLKSIPARLCAVYEIGIQRGFEDEGSKSRRSPAAR